MRMQFRRIAVTGIVAVVLVTNMAYASETRTLNLGNAGTQQFSALGDAPAEALSANEMVMVEGKSIYNPVKSIYNNVAAPLATFGSTVVSKVGKLAEQTLSQAEIALNKPDNASPRGAVGTVELTVKLPDVVGELRTDIGKSTIRLLPEYRIWEPIGFIVDKLLVPKKILPK
jgi:hypothetical protein